jgi:hypothetical protein
MENFRLYAMSTQSVFCVALQAGLSALKTPQCYRAPADRNTECPGKNFIRAGLNWEIMAANEHQSSKFATA